MNVKNGVALVIKDTNELIYTDVYTIFKFILATIRKTNKSIYYYGIDPLYTSQMDYFIDYSKTYLHRKNDLDIRFDNLEQHLQDKSLLVEHNLSYEQGDEQIKTLNDIDIMLTIADLLVYSVLKANFRTNILLKDKKYKNINRWFNLMQNSSLHNLIANYETLINQKIKEKSKGGNFEIDLPNAITGKVVTRFPPEPSGYLHIGHVKAVLLNDYFAKKYKGKMILRFDDTNPSKEKQEYVENIIQDLKTLGVEWCKLTHTSDHFDYLYEQACLLIKENKAYIDDTPYEQLREEKMAGIASKCRNRDPLESLKLFQEEMYNGTKLGQKICLRGKLDITSHNKTLFDPVFYRCNVDTPHVRTGTKWKMYPTYDYACPLVDSLEGVTHTLRTSEYALRDEQYMMILDLFKNMRKPNIWEYSRLNFKYTLMSKRKLKWFVEEHKVDGWNDPRFPTIQGILRRGMTITGLRNFILLQGASKSSNLMDWGKLWNCNLKVIDPISYRLTALTKNQLVIATIDNFQTYINDANDSTKKKFHIKQH